MIRKFLTIIGLILLVFAVWLFWPEGYPEGQNRPVKKRIVTEGTYLFGRRKWTTLGRTETFYNKKGERTQEVTYDADTITDKYVYLYTKFDSLEKTVYYMSKKLLPVSISIINYNDLNRPATKLEYEVRYKVNKVDTFLNSKTTFYYNTANKVCKLVTENFTEKYKDGDRPYITNDGGNERLFSYNNKGQLICDSGIIIFGKDIKNDTSITNYTYDSNGFLKARFWLDSLYYHHNREGKVLEIIEKDKGLLSTNEKDTYDNNGNLIMSFVRLTGKETLDLTYYYKYDKYKKLVFQSSTSEFNSIFTGGDVYTYEYY